MAGRPRREDVSGARPTSGPEAERESRQPGQRAPAEAVTALMVASAPERQNTMENRPEQAAGQDDRRRQRQHPGEREIAHRGHLQPRSVRRHRAGDARRQHLRRRHRQPVDVGGGDGGSGDELGRRALRVGQVALADLLAHRDDDALPPDHRPEAERNRDRDLDPDRNVPRRVVQLVAIELRSSASCLANVRARPRCRIVSEARYMSLRTFWTAAAGRRRSDPYCSTWSRCSARVRRAPERRQARARACAGTAPTAARGRAPSGPAVAIEHLRHLVDVVRNG